MYMCIFIGRDEKTKYKLGYVTYGSTAFKRIGCKVPSVARVLLGPEGL